MYVASYDTNTGSWHHEETNGGVPGPVAALDWLCADNQQQDQDNGTLCGPLAHSGTPEQYQLSAAWTFGRQWFRVLAIFSLVRLPDAELEKLLLDIEDDEEDDEEDDDPED